MLEFYSGSTNVVNSKRAMAECLEIALGDKNTDCDLIVLYSAIGHDFKDLLSEAKKRAPSARIIGCSCAGVIGIEGASESMKTLGIMAVRGPKEQFALAWVDDIKGANSFDAAAVLAGDLQRQNSRISMIHLLAPGIDISADRVISGIESIFGEDIPIFGAASSDNMKAVSSFQFADDRVFERGAVAVGFSDPTLDVITGATHGFEVIGLPFTVTKVDANRVYELDGKPAWDCFTQSLGLLSQASLKETIPVGALAGRSWRCSMRTAAPEDAACITAYLKRRSCPGCSSPYANRSLCRGWACMVLVRLPKSGVKIFSTIIQLHFMPVIVRGILSNP